ncbi:MAG: long-chain fatty acid--CoA ligase, partial [Deltaproteobacteria bacterium]|nr:long-chain fatty acid--CoA ligase [Deltaproteobacteria bacterium]
AMSEQIEPSDDAMIVYTSGTTALPKGVVHLQRAPVIQAWRFAEQMGLTSDDVVYSTYPFFWTAGIAMALGGSLASGARLVVDEIFDPGRALSRIESERATAVQAWPHQEKAMADHPSAGERDLSSVTKVEFARSIAKLVGLEKDEWGTHGSYGMSETFTICSSVPATADAIIREETSGLPLPGMTLRIVDPETGARLPDHEKGEIAVKGLTLMRGYHKVDPERVFDEDGFFHSQDAGSFDAEGYLRWSGRLSNLIKTGGANVSPLEIEGVLAEREDLRVAMAVGIPHPTLGEVVVLCAVPAAGQQPTEDEIRKFLRGRLAAYKIPKRVLFFEAGDLSLTANQKIQVDPLRKAAQQRLEQEHAEIDGATYTPTDP